MSLRNCIATKISHRETRNRLLAIAGDEELETQVLLEFGKRKKDLSNLIADSKKRVSLEKEMVDYTEPSVLDPKKLLRNPFRALANIISGPTKSMEVLGDSIITQLHRTLEGHLSKAKVKSVMGKWFSKADDTWNRHASMAIQGDEVVEPELAAFGKAFRKIGKEVAERINKAGGRINVKEDFYLPHIQAADRVKKADLAQWKADVKKHFDMENFLYEGSEKTIDDVLDKMFSNIVDPTSAGAGIGRSFRRRMNTKSGKDWYEFNKKYGNEDVFGTIMKYLDSSGRQIAALETLGPNPRQMVEQLSKKASGMASDLKLKGKVVKDGGLYAEAAVHRYNNLMGFTTTGSPFWSGVGQTLRAIQVVTKLGLAPVTAITDTGFSVVAAQLKGMPVMRMLKTQLIELFTKRNSKFLAQMGVVSDVVINDIRAAHRYADVGQNGNAVKIASLYTKVIGLNRWTNTMKTGHAYELLAHMTNIRGKRFGDLSNGMKFVLDQYKIDRGVWSHLQEAGTVQYRGATFIEPAKIADRESREKFLMMLQAETRYAVPEPTAASRAALNFGHAPGTLAGEFLRVGTQFKSFPVSVMLMHLARIRALPTQSTRAFYTSKLLAGTTILGVMSLWIKDILNGRDPHDITPKFVVKAMVHGGATGLMGDVMYNVGEYGGGVGDFVAGPSAGLMNVLLKAAREIMDDEKTLKEYSGKLTATALKQVGQSASYGKLLVNSYLIDGLQEFVYPDIRKQRRKKIKREKREGITRFKEPGKPSRRGPKAPKIDF